MQQKCNCTVKPLQKQDDAEIRSGSKITNLKQHMAEGERSYSSLLRRKKTKDLFFKNCFDLLRNKTTPQWVIIIIIIIILLKISQRKQT